MLSSKSVFLFLLGKESPSSSPSMLSFSGCVTLWHVFQPFPFPLPLCTASLFYIPLLSTEERSRGSAFAFVPFKAMLPPQQQRTTARSLFLCRCLLHIDYSHLGISTWSQSPSTLRPHFFINAISAVGFVEFLPLKRESIGHAESFI